MNTIPYQEQHFPFWSRHEVRFSDMDALGHVNNARFFTYLEEARIRFIQTLPPFVEAMSRGESFVLAHIELKLIKPIHYPSVVLVGTGAESFGNSSITGVQAIYEAQSKVCHAVARTTGVWFNTKTQRPQRLPEFEDRERLLVAV